MKEDEIRKRETVDKYFVLVRRDIKLFFKSNSFIEVPCPACEGGDYLFEFKKAGFDYVSCKRCLTLFVNPRPPVKALNKFYSKSASTDYWVNEFFKPVVEVRRKKIFLPRAKTVSKILKRNNQLIIGDIGAGYGLFLEELRKILGNNQYVAIEPSHAMAEVCRQKGFDVKCDCLENIKPINRGFDFLAAFELFEHLFDPAYFLKRVHSLLRPGGKFLLTTLNSEGFDIQVLWRRSKNIFPPMHLNFFNPSSLRILLERNGFKIKEISTPGKIDWDIVEGMIRNEGVKLDRFWNLLAGRGSEECKEEFQAWISKHSLSSHMRALAHAG